jgi:hypothetical protein
LKVKKKPKCEFNMRAEERMLLPKLVEGKAKMRIRQ